MTDLHGWAGNVLLVDLSSRSISLVPTYEYEPEKYIGGVGLMSKIFWEMGCPQVDALHPDSPLLIANGPLTGLPGPFSRGHVCGIAPQSYPQELFTYSGFAGRWNTELKYAGYDALVVVGQADRPVYLSIRDKQIEIKEADHLWGLDIFETQRVLMEEDPDLSVLSIGPAGENLCRNAVIATETGSTAGQGGFGAVMGSKKLKAISVHGTGSVTMAHPHAFLDLVQDMKRAGKWLRSREDLRAPLFPGQVQEEMVRYRKKFCGAYGCPYLCMSYYDVPGIGKGAAQCVSFWYQFLNKQDTRAVWKGTLDAQRLGLNHYDLLGIVWVLDDLYKQGLLVWEDWEEAAGSAAPTVWGGELPEDLFVANLIQTIVKGSSPFSQGAARAFDRLLETAHHRDAARIIYETRFPAHGYTIHFMGWLGFALHWAVDVRDPGGDVDEYHDFSFAGDWLEEGQSQTELYRHYDMPGGDSTFAHPAQSGKEVVYEGIERQTHWTHKAQSIKNSLPMCAFQAIPSMYFLPPAMDYREFQARAFSAVTGITCDAESLWRTGERIWNLRRAIMVRREDRRRELDTFHNAIFDTQWEEPEGHMRGDTAWAQFNRSKFEAMKSRYYALFGWNVDTGRPTRDNLEKLDIPDIADRLEEEGLLG